VDETQESWVCPFCQAAFDDDEALRQHFCPLRPGH
jgi:hypothetical protein